MRPGLRLSGFPLAHCGVCRNSRAPCAARTVFPKASGLRGARVRVDLRRGRAPARRLCPASRLTNGTGLRRHDANFRLYRAGSIRARGGHPPLDWTGCPDSLDKPDQPSFLYAHLIGSFNHQALCRMKSTKSWITALPGLGLRNRDCSGNSVARYWTHRVGGVEPAGPGCFVRQKKRGRKDERKTSTVENDIVRADAYSAASGQEAPNLPRGNEAEELHCAD